MTVIDRKRLQNVLQNEISLFSKDHPECYKLYQRAKGCLLDGVPMNWMVRWAGGFPLFVKEAKGASFTCADGKHFIDFCLGDTGAMVGHSPEKPMRLISEQLKKGITFMLPTEDAIWVGEELQRRFGLKYWQTSLTATDANRFVLRLARHITKRPYVLVFDYCYHGSVDETFITLNDGIPGPRPGAIGPQVNPVITTRVVPWNNLQALEQALAPGDVACVLAEPVMTNIGIIHPQPGYHEALRELTKKYGTLLVIDETHTMCTGPGGYTAAHGLKPDILTVGKTIGSGIPAAVYGFTEEVGDMVSKSIKVDESDVGGIGGTLAGNALSLAAMRATLENALDQKTFDHTIPLAIRFTDGVKQVIDELNLQWVINRLGCRAEYWFCDRLPQNGGEAEAAVDAELDRYMHLAALNRGILMTPFHNMALIAPDITEKEIDTHTRVFREIVMVLADYNKARTEEVQAKLKDPKKFPAEFIDASKKEMIVALAKKYNVDLIMNACDPSFNIPIFDAAYEAGCNYMDMAMTLSEPHPKDPYNKTGIKLGDYQFERAKQWKDKGILALLGLGVEPGMADIFAKYAELHLFDEIDEIGVRDGANLIVKGYDFAPNFSIWTTIEECLNPPVIWEKGKDWFTTEPFSEPETFDFPGGIGPVECVNVEHEEVLLVPRYIKCNRVTFKYGLGDEFIGILKTLHMLGLDNKEPIKVKGVEVAPRDVVAACLPDPAHIGHLMEGQTCAGTWIKGKKDGKEKQVYLYQVADNKESMDKFGCQVVVTQTGFNAVIGMELLATKKWVGTGVDGPEAFDPIPFMDLMADYGFPWGIKEW